MKYNSIIYSHQDPENFKNTHEYTSFLYIWTPWKIISQKTNFDTFFGANNYSTTIYFKICTAYMYELVRGTHFIWVSISIQVDNSTAKVPISEKSGHVSKGQPPRYGTSHWCQNIYWFFHLYYCYIECYNLCGDFGLVG